MKNPCASSKYSFMVEFASSQGACARKIKWDGVTPLFLGYPFQWSLELRADQLYCRNLIFAENQKFSVHVENLQPLLNGLKESIEFENSCDRFLIRKLIRLSPANSANLNRADVPVLSNKSPLPTADTLLFRRSLKEVSVSTIALFLGLSFWASLSVPKKEELIPQQFAKMILKKPTKTPKNTQAVASSGGSVHRAKDSAVAQAFRSQAVQKSVQSLLRGGLSKFNTAFSVPSAKALGALADAEKRSRDKSGALRGLASQVLGSSSGVKVGSVGAGSGYGSGAGTSASVAGQGKGFVSLDTQEATVDEGLTKEEVARVIHAHMSEIRYCYESAILRNSNLEGKLLIDFQIAAAGSVKLANKKESSVSEASVSDCVIRRLMTWQFPKPRGGVTVAISYPFLFKTVKR